MVQQNPPAMMMQPSTSILAGEDTPRRELRQTLMQRLILVQILLLKTLYTSVQPMEELYYSSSSPGHAFTLSSSGIALSPEVIGFNLLYRVQYPPAHQEGH